jgi:hypothetical protein
MPRADAYDKARVGAGGAVGSRDQVVGLQDELVVFALSVTSLQDYDSVTK